MSRMWGISLNAPTKIGPSRAACCFAYTPFYCIPVSSVICTENNNHRGAKRACGACRRRALVVLFVCHSWNVYAPKMSIHEKPAALEQRRGGVSMLVPHMGLKEGGARFSPSIVVAVPVVVLVAVLVVCIIPSVYGTPLDSNSIASVHKSFLHKLDCNTMSSSCISSMGRVVAVVAVVVVVLVAVLVVVLVVESISASSNSA
jgi:hypothetical protein